MGFTHPLARSPLAFTLHLAALATLSWAFVELWKPGPFTELMDSAQAGGRWHLAASWLTFLFALLHDAVPLDFFSRCKTTLAILTVPVEGLVAFLYWSLTLYDPSLLNPAVAPGEEPFRIPLSLDLAIHFFPAVFLWTDFLLFSPPFPKQARPTRIATTATAAYCLWMERCAKINGAYPYPMLDPMTPAQRSVFYLAQVPILIGLYHAANAVHRAVRGSSSPSAEAARVRRAEEKVGKAL
ncbi:hypothetical protein Rhopal_000093-T1 [Rhodotorula paludigena]|uniref:Uncharacterized protein n=1 Tax=Rhodotorula paludigena TaxID=86838 RepID=A0AAV5GAN7_9BASI|nr:hypothetical protein Rhopal_000093-T1 [Rhodotorula paludigena]